MLQKISARLWQRDSLTDAFHKLINPCLLEVQEAGGGAGRVGGLRRVGGGGGGGVHRDCHRHREALLQRLSSLCTQMGP
jgi:hypothetical protein